MMSPPQPTRPCPRGAGGWRRGELVDAVHVGGGGEQAADGHEHLPQRLGARGAARDQRVAGVDTPLAEDANRQHAGERDVCGEGDEDQLQEAAGGAGGRQDPSERTLLAQAAQEREH